MLQGRSVLVVEDEADSRELLLIVLSRFGANVRGAASVPEAWAMIGEERPDVLVSDIGMPIEDGYSLIRRVRAQFSSEEMPAIALTAYTANEDRHRALSEGFDAHITKPSSPIHLAMSVAALLEARQGLST
jgi:CheY-like chemotaxis protein